MHYLGAAAKAENGSDVGRRAPLDLARIFHVVSAETAPNLCAGWIENNDSVTAGKAAVDADDACRRHGYSPEPSAASTGACSA